MEKKVQVLLTFIALVVLIAGLYMFTNWFSLITGYFTGEDERAQVAQCLSEQGAELYDSLYCPDCEKQKAEFGPAVRELRIVDCGPQKELCPNIREIPAWFIPHSQDKIHYGFKTLEELKTLSGCTI